MFTNDAAGAYTITIRNEISVPDDATKATSTLIDVEYTFTIFIDPCQVNTYLQSSQVGTITYAISTPTVVSPSYVFDESPVCNYPETVTVTDLPAFMTHETGSATFTVPSTTDLSLVGTYTFTVRSEISVPVDYTMAPEVILFEEEVVTVIIDPCFVATYFDSITITEITYNIGDPTLTDGPYEFSESPVCNYPEVVTVTGLPPFATHNEGTADFTIP